MPHKVVEVLKHINPGVILNSLEEAIEVLVNDGLTLEESIALLDNYADPIWVENRQSLLDTINNRIMEWDQENQILTRTFLFKNEELYFNYRNMINEIFPPTPRSLNLLSVEDAT